MFRKQDKVPNKGPSTNDFTDEYKKKLDKLENYNDTNIKEKQIKQELLLLELQEKNSVLESQIPTKTVIEEKVYLEDSSNIPFKNFKITGNYRQEEHKASANILDLKKLIKGFINSETGLIESENSTYPNSVYTQLITLKLNDTLNLFNVPSKGARIRVYNIDNSFNTTSSNNTTYTAIQDCKVRVLFLDTVLNDTMIKLNDSNTTYVEFSPNMPSIEYPSEIKECAKKGCINIKKSNKNLAEIENGNIVDATGLEQIATNCIRTKFIPFSNKIKLIVQFNASFETRYKLYYLYDKDKNFIASNSYINEKVITTSKGDVAFIRFKLYGPANENITINDLNFQVEEGSTVTEIIKHEGTEYTIPVQKPILTDDYLDFKNEEEVHFWKKIDNYNKEKITTEFLSSTGELSIGATVYYKSEEVKLPFTEEQKIVTSQILTDKNFNNVTHLYSEDEIKPKIEVKYYKDLDTVIKNNKQNLQTQIDEIKSLLSSTTTSAVLVENLEKDLIEEV